MPDRPLPVGAPLKFWRDEIDRATRTQEVHHADWDENLQWYAGRSPDASAMPKNSEFVNVNVDFYQTEQKLANLFYETPDLQLTGTGELTGQTTIIAAHKALMTAILGENHMDVLQVVHSATKDCLAVSGTGPVMLGYEPTVRLAPPQPQLGAVLQLRPDPIPVAIYERWYAERFSPKKFLIPAEFHSTDWDKAPWLGMRFRMPLVVARKTFQLPATFTGTTTKDEHVLDAIHRVDEATSQPYIDGQVLWYRAALFEPDAEVHPEQYRELVLIDALDQPARHRDSPHQTIGPQGRMTGDSLIGNPIHPLTIRTMPDHAYVPSDSMMTRPLVRELCKFRTQMVQERDANRSRVLYDVSAFPPEVLTAIEEGTIGSLIGVESGKLLQGIGAIMAEVVKGTGARQSYTANDYIQSDIDKTNAMGPNQVGQNDPNEGSATQTKVMDRTAQARQAHEQRQVLRWYLRLVDKVSALVCRYMTPQMAVPYIGQELAQAWGQWDKTKTDGRLSFSAKPDSQIRLDAAGERKFALDVYNFAANDPNTNRVELLKNLFVKAGMDPAKAVVEQLPEQKPKPNVGFTFKGEDFVGPQAPIVLDICKQVGIEISPEATQAASQDVAMQMLTGLRDGAGAVVKPPAEHGGPAQKARPLSKQQGELAGERSGPKVA